MQFKTAGTFRINHLYHYQSFNAEFLREVIVDGVIHFSRPSDFNDPWDCRPWFDYDCLADPEIHEQHVQWYLEISRRNRSDIPEAVIQRTADVYRNDLAALAAKVQECSEAMAGAIENQYRIYCLSPKADSELMWAHYAAKHQGVCLEFEVRNDLFYHGFEVQYSVDYPRHRMTGFSGLDEHIAPLLTKSAAWSYENEFRLISDEKGDARESIVTAD